MLGLNSTFARAVKKSAFGAVPDTFVMDEVQMRPPATIITLCCLQVKCEGTEAQLDHCPHRDTDDCSGDEGAGVICFGGEKGDLLIINHICPCRGSPVQRVSPGELQAGGCGRGGDGLGGGLGGLQRTLPQEEGLQLLELRQVQHSVCESQIFSKYFYLQYFL